MLKDKTGILSNFMNFNYDNWLLAVSIIASSATLLVTFAFVKRLYLSTISSKKILLPIYSAAVGGAVWANHFLLSIGFHDDATALISPLLALAGLPAALAIGTGLLFLASRSYSKVWHFMLYGFISSLFDLALFYCSTTSLHEAGSFKFDPVITFLATGISGIITTIIAMLFYWIRSYSGKYPNYVKVLLATGIAIGIFAIHVVFESGILHETDLATAITDQNHRQMTGIVIGLGMICLFMMLLIFTLFFEKHGNQLFAFSFFKTKKNGESQSNAMLDSLTKLPNRESFQQYLESATKRSARMGTTFALAYMDLDHFKPINDLYGHQVGDIVLTTVAERLIASVRSCDFVARIGGDEFVVIFEPLESDDDISPIADRIVKSIKESITVNNYTIDISCSMGIALYPKDGNLDKLITCADAAMYKAKENGKNQFRFYDEEIESASDIMLVMQRDLCLALENNEFSLVFQPKVDCKSLALIGAEAFIRWNHPTKGLLFPSLFIPAAERFGLINQINNWVIEEACIAIYRAKESDVDLNLSINLSRIQFRNSSLVDETIKCLNKYGVPSQNLTLEIKETTAIRNEAQFKLLITKFKAAKVKIALDDFGLNPFTLEYLQELNVDELKLDNVFVSRVNENPESHALVDAVIRLAHAFNLNVVAEGVETETQRRALEELGCDHMQGYLFSKPVPEAELLKMFKSQPIQLELNSPILTDNNLSEAIEVI
jgi:diguanylate cyclase